MDALLWYFLKSNLFIAILLLGYYIFFRREKFFFVNRIYLIASIVTALSLPIAPKISPFTFSEPKLVDFNIFKDANLRNHSLNGPTSGVELELDHFLPAKMNKVWFSGWYVIVGIYLLISFFFFVRLGVQLHRLFRVIRKSEKRKLKGIIFCTPEQVFPACSFFNFIIINKAQFTVSEYRQIRLHEIAHCRQWHSLDVLLVEIVYCLLWINPLMLLLRRSIKLNLEFLADEAVLNTGANQRSYQYHILSSSSKPFLMSLNNFFYSSKTKERIRMINQVKPSRIRLINYAFTVPLIIGLCMVIQAFEAKSGKVGMNMEFLGNLRKLEGKYQLANADHVLIRISSQSGKLVLEQLWDNEAITFQQESDLDFYNEEKSFPLRFIEDDGGFIKEMIAYNKDLWNKVGDQEGLIKNQIQLAVAELQKMEGYYQFGDTPYFLHIYVESNGLIAKEMWTGKEIEITPESDMNFYSKRGNFTIEFGKDAEGHVSKAIVFNKDVWHKTKTYTPIEKKQVYVAGDVLKRYEGKYATRSDWVLSITKKDNRLLVIVNDGEQVDILPESETKFFLKADPTTTIEFINGESGSPEKALLVQHGVPMDAARIQ